MRKKYCIIPLFDISDEQLNDFLSTKLPFDCEWRWCSYSNNTILRSMEYIFKKIEVCSQVIFMCNYEKDMEDNLLDYKALSLIRYTLNLPKAYDVYCYNYTNSCNLITQNVTYKMQEIMNMSLTHELKCEEYYFELARDGLKNFELRKLDRDYQIGDNIILINQKENCYVIEQEKLYFKIKYILRDYRGLEEGYGILGTEPIKP